MRFGDAMNDFSPARHRLDFYVGTWSVYREVRREFVRIFYVNFMLQSPYKGSDDYPGVRHRGIRV